MEEQPLTDCELRCVAEGFAERMSPEEFDKFVRQYLDLTKIDLWFAQWFRENCVDYMTSALKIWRNSKPEKEARRILYTQLSKAADNGLVERSRIEFLMTTEKKRVSGFQEIFYDGRKRRQVVFLTLITCYQLILGTLGILYMKNHTFLFDKRTVIALSIFTDSLDSIVILLTAILFLGGLTQIVLIFWCCVSFSDAPLRVQTVIQKKTESVYSCTFVPILSCVLFSLFETLDLGCAFELFPMSIERGRDCYQRTMSSLNYYSSNPHIAERWNQLQVGYECCGAYNYSDWYIAGSPNNVPDSCCKQVANGCGRNISNAENIHQMGCFRSFVIHIRAEIGQVECLAIAGLFILWFVSVWVYGCLFNEGRFFQVTRLPILLLLMLVLMCLYAFVYPCKYMYRRIKDSQPSNSAKDGKIVTKVVLDEHNRNDTAVEVGRLDANDDTKIDIGDENANLLSVDDSKRK